MKERVRAPRLGKLAILTCLLFAFSATSAAAQVGGPVILGGDDMPDHGSHNGTDNLQGWLYLQRAVENVMPNVKRANNNGKIAALGSAEGDGDAGNAIENAAAEAGVGVDYYNGAAAIDQFFADLASGATNPAMIWIAGDSSGGDLDNCSGPATEGQELIDNAPAIDSFVNSGGGLISHGVCYEWLQSLLPNAEVYESGDSGDLYFTAEGSSAFPGLTVADINAGPWHNHFQGDLGGLEVLVRSADVHTEDYPQAAFSAAGQTAGTDAPVIIGGAGVSLTQGPADLAITKGDEPDPIGVGDELTYSLTVTNNGPDEATNVVVTDDLPAGVTFERTNTSQGSCTGTGPVTCNLGRIASGSAVAIGIVVRPTGPGTITNVARVSGDQPDPESGNNEGRTDTNVLAPAAPGEPSMCSDNRPFLFRTHHAPGHRVKRARAWVNGEKVLDRKSKKNIARFRIPRQPQVAGTVVKIVLKHTTGTKITSLRIYNECGKTKPTFKVKRKKSKK